MLEQNDLKILAGMFNASEERMMKRMDSLENRMESMENRMESMENRMNEMDTRLSSRIDELDTRLSSRIDELDTRLGSRIDSLEVQMKKSEDLFMNELAKTSGYLETRIDAVQKSVDRVEQYYRADRLENENTATLLKLYIGLREDVDELKERIA